MARAIIAELARVRSDSAGGPAVTPGASRGRRRSQALRDQLAHWLRARPRAARVLVATVDRLGAAALGDRIVRTLSGDVVVARLPPCPGIGTPRLVLHRVGGRDQSALAVEGDWRAWEPPMPTVFWALCRQSAGQVLDVGANTGIYSLLALLSYRQRLVTAFEPVPAIRAMLADNVALGGFGERVRVRAEAVGAAAGTARLFLPPSVPDGFVETSASLAADFKADARDSLQVQVTSLDEWWAGAGRPAVALVKVDVESCEYDVLRGAGELVDAQRPALFYELLPQGDAAGITGWAARRDLVDIRLLPTEAVVGHDPVFDPDAWNHLLIPAERLEQTVALLRECGLAVTH